MSNRFARAFDRIALSEGQGPVFWGVVLVIMAASVSLHLASPTPDVSWLITVCEKIRAGAVAYIDILETNPPVPVLLYMPAVVAGQTLGVTPESALTVITYLCGLLILALTGRILPEDPPERSGTTAVLLLTAVVILFVACSDSFAQREYFAAMFALPMVAVFIRHLETGDWPPLAERAIAAVLAGLTVAIKPPLFALPGLVIFAWYLWRTRSLAFAVRSGLVPAGILAVLMTAASFYWFPHYLDKVGPLMRDVYVPARSEALAFLADPSFIATSCFIIIFALAALVKKYSATEFILFLTGMIFFTIYFVQRKYFPYHMYAATVFLSMSCSLIAFRQEATARHDNRTFRNLSRIVFTAGVAGSFVLAFVGFRDASARMPDLSWAAKYHHPTVMAITPDLAAAFPLAREIGGRWVDGTHSAWVARYTRFMLARGGLSMARQQQLRRYHDEDLRRLLGSLEKNRPELILVDLLPAYAWLMTELKAMQPGFLDRYVPVVEEGRIDVLQRRGLERGTQ